MPWRLKPCPHCRRKVRLSPNSATVAVVSPFSATVALFCDSVDNGHGFKMSRGRERVNELTSYGVHIHEDLGDNNGGIQHYQYTDDGVQCWTSTFQQTSCPTSASTPQNNSHSLIIIILIIIIIIIIYLNQRVSLAVQRYNSVAFKGTFLVYIELD